MVITFYPKLKLIACVNMDSQNMDSKLRSMKNKKATLTLVTYVEYGNLGKITKMSFYLI